MFRLTYMLLLLWGCLSMAVAQPSEDYYASADGLRQVELKLALKHIIENHSVLEYSRGLAKAYEYVYARDDDSTLVYDIFSREDYQFTPSRKWNREHVVPNSWWNGERNAAYTDLFRVIPAESTANRRKSNYPIGVVEQVSWTNDCIKVGIPAEGQGGSYNRVFEPADEYKGDFARIYFYVATCYSDIGWGTRASSKSELNREDWPTLNPWLCDMLLQWHNQDPVCEREKDINNRVETLQGNRNPFIDYPSLADYIWGDYVETAFCLDSAVLYQHVAAEGIGHIDTIEHTPADTADSTHYYINCNNMRKQTTIKQMAALGIALSMATTQTVAQTTDSRIVENGGTGNYKAVMLSDASLDAHTIFVPQNLENFGKDMKLPVLIWGNGACNNSPFEHYLFLNEIASHGYIVVATGYMPQEGEHYQGPRSTSEQQIEAIDWVMEQNKNKDSKYYGKIDTDKICVAGMSCGGLQTLYNCADKRITTLMVCNSGLFINASTAMPGMPMPSKDKLKEIHTPTIYILGGETDIAYGNGMDDFRRISHVPACVANYPVGHGGTYGQPHGGEFSIVALAWLDWQLKGDKKAAKMFTGTAPELANRKDWTLERNEKMK